MQKPNRKKSKRILISIALLILGFAFSGTFALWIHEGGHIIGALLTGSQINGIYLMPPWEGHVNATYHSVFAGNVFFLGGFFVSFVLFLCVFVASIMKRSRIAYFMLYPLLMTVLSSQGDLKFVGFYIPEFVAFIIGWVVPAIFFVAVLFFYEGLFFSQGGKLAKGNTS